MGHAARIRHVDAFTSVPLEGNPAAVVDGAGIDDATMQRIALNQRLSETVFLLPPADTANHASIRIFTPAAELPFAGHPTLASAHVLVSEGVVKLSAGETLRIETKAGLIPLEVDATSAMYTMTQRPPGFRAWDVAPDDVARWLGLRPGDVARCDDVSTGVWWHLAQIASWDAMQRIQPDLTLLGKNDVSVFCIGPASDADVRVRSFVPGLGIPEDPVTGSSNGCIAALIAREGLLPSRDGTLTYIAEQGIEMGQPGRIYLTVDGMPDALSVRVGGQAVTVLQGELLVP